MMLLIVKNVADNLYIFLVRLYLLCAIPLSFAVKDNRKDSGTAARLFEITPGTNTH